MPSKLDSSWAWREWRKVAGHLDRQEMLIALEIAFGALCAIAEQNFDKNLITQIFKNAVYAAKEETR